MHAAFRALTLITVFTGAGALGPAWAQEVDIFDVGLEQLEEILVVARKRTEDIQQVPISVSAVTKGTLERAYYADTTAIAKFSPNLVFEDVSAGTPGGGAISIRGISFQDVEKSFDPAVMINVDGVAMGTNTGNVFNLIDIERIEVLRGPQGTLFGRNAVGGVINVFRTKPVLGEWGGKVRLGIEEEDGHRAEGVVNVPLGNTLAAKLTLASVERPGYYKNITNGDDEGKSEEVRWGIHLLWQPVEQFRAEVQFNKSDGEGIIPPMLNIQSSLGVMCAEFGLCAASEDLPLSGDRTKGAGDLHQDFTLDTEDYILELDWNITEQLSAVLIAGHREIDETAFYDFDGGPLEIFPIYRPNSNEQDSVELRLSFESERLSVTGGYYYFNSKLKDWVNVADIAIFLGLPTDACGFGLEGDIACSQDNSTYESSSDSFFAEGEYRFTDQLSLIAGLRYIDESKEIAKERTLPETGGKRSDNDTIYRVGLRWEPTDALMTYVTFSTGFRSGGFSIRAQTLDVLGTGFAPETLENFEIGFKTTLLENRLRLNGSVFFMDYKDMQQEVSLQNPDPTSTGVQSGIFNAAAATINGAELELTAIVSENFSLEMDIGYLEASYDTFQAKLWPEQPDAPTPAQLDLPPPDGWDVSDLPLRRAPDWTYSIALNYDQELAGGVLGARVSFHYIDDVGGTLTDFPRTHKDSTSIVDASVYFTRGDWRLGVWGRNLSNEDAYQHTFVSGPLLSGASTLTFATPRPPRAFGVELGYSFGGY